MNTSTQRDNNKQQMTKDGETIYREKENTTIKNKLRYKSTACSKSDVAAR